MHVNRYIVTCFIVNRWPYFLCFLNAGRFALSFILGNHLKRQERKAAKSGDEGADDEDVPDVTEPEAEPAQPAA